MYVRADIGSTHTLIHTRAHAHIHTGTHTDARMLVHTNMQVPAGSVSLEGSLVLRVTASMEDSTPARSARMATKAQVGFDL